MKLRIVLLAIALSIAGGALAQRKAIQLPSDDPASQLKPGAGVNLANLNCAICHSVDYIIRQPRMDAAAWQAEVKKMIAVFGAPIRESDATIIAQYLVANYGSQTAPPEPVKPTARPRN